MLLYVIKKEKGNPIKIYKIIKAKHKIRKFRLFDKKYYLKKYPNVKSIINPLDHYIYHGYKEYKNPSELFDNNYYLNKYSDVKKSGHNPLIHYVLYGKKEGRFPNKKSENNSIESLYSRLEKQKKKIKKLEEKIKKQSKIYKIKSINKEKISWQIEKFGDLGIIKKKRNPKLIVSLTSYPDRIYDIHYCLYSLLNQSLKPDEVILWLSREEFKNLEEDIPKKTLQLRKNGLKIKWCDNLKSYKKLIFALKEYPNDIIVTADDDVYYPKNWLEKIYNEYDEKTIVCHRAHFVNFDDSKFKKYKDWDRNIENKNASFLNFATGVGGVLYPPKSLHPDVLNEDLFIKLAPNADDIWFWVMGVLNGIKTKVVPDGYRILNYINPKRELNVENEETLYSKNKNGGNDNQMENIVNYYPQIKNILKNEYSPKVSIIIPVHNTSKYLKKCMDSVINQKLKDIEIICINDESRDNSLEILEDYARKDKRIKIINQVNQGVSIARNTGLKIAKGEYVGFVDSDDWIDLNFFYELYNKAKSQGADLARTFYKYEYPYKRDEEKLNKIIKKRNKEREQLNVNDHSVVIWNAIYKRKYIEKNKI
ncbi:MAG: glycosyltransferase [Methanobrevibacter arboriphilus]|uniref:Glycosyltransferase n=1 Tax=Methanobrevibacter arboriphilus TaxID=39441 RepID=A0A843ADT0_METAZ|nr:glycosyltransferase [Methanobrevibacter arboriphilus]MBF4468083.1 glycosyltransferase [Methanobrevibacter arboriphilus]